MEHKDILKIGKVLVILFNVISMKDDFKASESVINVVLTTCRQMDCIMSFLYESHNK